MNFGRKLASAAASVAVGLGMVTMAGIGIARADDMSGMDMSRYGGPVYSGPPALNVTASLVKAGGGADNFSIATALTSMVGPKLVTAEVGKLTTQYGSDKVTQWITTFNFAVGDALKIATADGVTLPDGTLHGKKLAVTLVKAGLDKNETFYTEFMLDKAVTHKIHCQVMDDIDNKYGGQVDTDYHAISNQAMADLAHALGYPGVQVASLH